MRDVLSRLVPLPSDQEELPGFAMEVKDLETLLKRPCENGCLHFIAWIPGTHLLSFLYFMRAFGLSITFEDFTTETRDKLIQTNKALFNAISLNVHNYGNWTENDVTDNGGIYGHIGATEALEVLLSKPRSYEVRPSQAISIIIDAEYRFHHRSWRPQKQEPDGL